MLLVADIDLEGKGIRHTHIPEWQQSGMEQPNRHPNLPMQSPSEEFDIAQAGSLRDSAIQEVRTACGNVLVGSDVKRMHAGLQNSDFSAR